jgi:hypothetical protein
MTVHAVVRFVTDLVKSWHKKRRLCFARLVWALMDGGRLGVAALGRRIPTATTVKHRIKSVDRFLGNEKVDLPALWAELMVLACRSSGRLYVLLDWSDLHHDDLEVLQAAVSYGGRSLPIAWSVSRKGKYERSRNLLETNFCRVLKALLPAGVELVIIADRGFGRASLMRALQRARIGFIIRVRKDVHLIQGRGCGPLRNRRIGVGKVRDLEDALYGENARFAGRCVITRGEKAKAPWYLWTNLHAEQGWSGPRVVAAYAKRMRIEQNFRDHKSMRFGFQLRSVKLSTAERYERLLAIAAVALLLLILLGARVEKEGLAARYKANTSAARTHSLFHLGLAFLGCLGLRRPPKRFLAWALNPEM